MLGRSAADKVMNLPIFTWRQNSIPVHIKAPGHTPHPNGAYTCSPLILTPTVTSVVTTIRLAFRTNK